MTIYRLPVVVSPDDPTPIAGQLPPKLACQDFDATGARVSSECADAFAASGGKFFKCKNRGLGPGKCHSGAFLYPRKWKGADKIHHHQGIDIASGHHGATIVSVCDGRVERAVAKEFVAGVGGYGRTIVIRESGRERWFLYAHCFTVDVREGQEVAAGQPIGTVGISDTFKPKDGKTVIFDGSDKSRAHLHFEVSESEYFKAQYTAESRPDDFVPGNSPPRKCRLDPLAELARLGPWGMRLLHLPTGGAVSAEAVTETHATLEKATFGGYFPLGANNTWHGGVHLRAATRSPIVAPFDGTIVAARLDPAPDPARTAFGSSNFIVLRHEIGETAYDRFRGIVRPPEEPGSPKKGGKKGGKPKKESVGKKASNPPDLVVQVKHALAERTKAGVPYYAPSDPARLDDAEVDAEFIDAIVAFQSDMERDGWAPDGKITVGAQTWQALFPPEPKPDPADPAAPSEPSEPPAPSDAKRTIYSVLMHLSAEPMTAALKKQVPWLGEVVLAPDPADPEEVAAAARRTAHAEDVAEAGEPFKGPIGPGVGTATDIQWVQKRLRRHKFYDGEPTGVFDATLEQAIRAFQEQHTAYYSDPANQPAPGSVNEVGKKKKSQTVDALRKTVNELSATEPPPPIDAIFVERCKEHDVAGVGRVLTDLDVKVRSGDVLWLAGQGRGLGTGAELAAQEVVHWEIFSTDPIVVAWPMIDDDTNDLTIDVPQRILDAIEVADGGTEFSKDGRLTASEIIAFYADGRGKFLRTTQCKFRSEWGLDVGAAVARLDEQGFATEGLAADLAPYTWWTAAAGAVPASPYVWHYNPIEFAGLYQSILDDLVGATPDVPADPDPSDEPEPPDEPEPWLEPGALDIWVVDAFGATQAGVHVVLRDDAFATVAEDFTDATGLASFEDLQPGNYGASAAGGIEDVLGIAVASNERASVGLQIA